MKKIFISLFVSVFMIGCIALPGEANTAFILKNTSEKPINMTIGVIKCSQAFGCQEYKNTFMVKPNDSTIARQTIFKKDSEKPQSWFASFEIFPVDQVEMNDPKKPENWIKSSKDKIQIYTFTLNK
ncbi:hypothetical protein [Chryseobacterium koreense]|nr:hypothetical protein [Chryseobacterium koreense]MBB5333653.1 hypothetical protein [Chryseobacterium koreense]